MDLTRGHPGRLHSAAVPSYISAWNAVQCQQAWRVGECGLKCMTDTMAEKRLSG